MSFRLEPNIRTLRMLKALDNPLRIKIIEYVVNSSPVAFSDILDHLEDRSGHKINKGTLAYHLDLLLQSNVLIRELERGEERTYTKYDITQDALDILRKLELLVKVP